MPRLLTAFVLLAGLCRLAHAADEAAAPSAPKPEPDKVFPSEYRIRVEYDQYTLDQIRAQIRDELKKALDARQRRLRLSREQLEAELKRELGKFDGELEAIRKVSAGEEAARKRGDLAEAERLRRLRIEWTRGAVDLAARIRRVEEDLLRASLEDWRAGRRKDQKVAEAALEQLDKMLAEIRAKEAAEERERGQTIAPPAPPAPPHE